MPVYRFKNKETNEVYDKVMSYDDMMKYRRKRHIEQVFVAPKIFRLNDMGGPEDQFREWCKQPETDIDTSKSNNFRHSKEEYMYGGKSDTD